MLPTPAEIARTLATGRLVGEAHVRGYPGRLRVRHATPADGQPLLLARVGGELAGALRPAAGEDDATVVLSVDDVPPVAGAPSRGRLWLSGWASALRHGEARTAAIEYAGVNPTSDLLDVGTGHLLYRIDVAEVRLARGETLTEIDVDAFQAAEPDPLHADEQDLLVDLNDHHGEELALLHGAATGAVTECRAVRVDRYGMVLATASRRIRVGFPRPVRGICDLARALHALNCPGCRSTATA